MHHRLIALYPQPKRILSAAIIIMAICHAGVYCQASPPTTLSAKKAAYPKKLDSEALLRQALDQCQRNIHDYTCLFTRQERIKGQLSKQQTIKVYFRESPRTIQMVWVTNPDRVRRALYQEGKYFNKIGEELLLVEPAGLIARAIAPTVFTPVRGKKARSAARHTVDQFGFLSILKRITNVNAIAKKKGDLTLTLIGEGQFYARPTYRMVRRLRTNGKQRYTDPHLVIELDQQWLIPVSIRSYDDADATKLLGAYTFRDIKMGNTLPNGTFIFKRNAVAMR